MTINEWHDGEPEPRQRNTWTDEALHDCHTLVWPIGMKMRQARGPNDDTVKKVMAFIAYCEKQGHKRK